MSRGALSLYRNGVGQSRHLCSGHQYHTEYYFSTLCRASLYHRQLTTQQETSLFLLSHFIEEQQI